MKIFRRKKSLEFVADKLINTVAPVVVADEEHWSGFRMDKIQALSA